jgi:GntR family transcriptional regulator
MNTPEYEPLDFGSGNPLYRQIAEQLYINIVEGRLAAGAALEPESTLQETFGVSRVTVRHALTLLVEQGLITRKQGKGSFVQARPIEFTIDSLQGTTELATKLGLATTSKIIQMAHTRGSKLIRRELALPPEVNVVSLSRLDFSGHTPLAHASIHLPETIGAKLSREQLAEEALYPLLERTLGIVATDAHQIIEAGLADDAAAGRLGIPVNSPIVIVTRTTRDQNNVPFEFSVVEFNAKLIRFSISLRRQLGEVKPYSYGEHFTTAAFESGLEL